MPDTDDCVTDLRHLSRYRVVDIDENILYIYCCAVNTSQINFKRGITCVSASIGLQVMT